MLATQSPTQSPGRPKPQLQPKTSATSYPNDAILKERVPSDVFDALRFWSERTPHETALALPEKAHGKHFSRSITWSQLLVGCTDGLRIGCADSG